MKKNHLFAKLHMGGVKTLRVVAILLFLCAAFGTSVAQTGSAQLDVSRLVGADPADIINTDNTHRMNPRTAEGYKHTFMLMNVATQQFLNIGGAYGRHATLDNTGMFLWIYKKSKVDGIYNIRTHQNIVMGHSGASPNQNNEDSYVQYIDNDPRKNGVYLDCLPTDDSRGFGWKFEQAEGFSATNKIYRLSTYGNRYLTATLDDADGNLCNAIAETSNSNYQVWKLVTVEEYYNLFDKSPSSVSAPIDISFLGKSLHFGYSKSDYTGWFSTVSGTSGYLVSGVDGYYKKFTDATYVGNNCTDDYLYENGKYFCASITNNKNGINQQLTVSKPGWYIFRCKGFSNTGKAKLYVTNYMNGDNSETLLNPLEANGPKNMLEAGEAFYADKYENEVMIYVSSANISESGYGAAYLVFGIKVGGDGSNTTSAWTAFGDFRILYAGDAPEAPQLVLDENNPDMRYLTETYYDYKNTVLHLNRSFSLNKWNTLILPVSLTYGQMKNAFGSEVLLAELYELNENSVRFKTVDCNSDADTMLEAYTPYIIKPTKAAGTNAAYTTPRLIKDANQYWLDENESITYNGDSKNYYTGGQVTIAANHYTIPEVTLDRSLFGTAFDKHWVSKTEINASTSDMVCKGTLAKTYYVTADKKGVFYTDGGETRDNLAGDYFMNKGEMWKVPAGKQYGLKAFRCWFELTNGTDPALNSTAPAKDVLLYIDGIADNATAIEDVEADPIFSNAKAAYADGVYNLYGQRVRNGSSLEGLPEGIYIVNGKKVKK